MLERDYQRYGAHPPSCTCADCVAARRRGKGRKTDAAKPKFSKSSYDRKQETMLFQDIEKHFTSTSMPPIKSKVQPRAGFEHLESLDDANPPKKKTLASKIKSGITRLRGRSIESKGKSKPSSRKPKEGKRNPVAHTEKPPTHKRLDSGKR